MWELHLPFLVYLLHARFFHTWLIDDAGISFVFARNFIQGLGFVPQAGVAPVEGFSNPLWTLLVSPLFLFELKDPTLPVKLLSYVLVYGTFHCIRQTARLFLRDRWWTKTAAFGALLSLSLNTSFVVWTGSGLENPLYALLIAVYCLSCVRYFDSEGRNASRYTHPLFAGLAAAGLTLTRPDGVLFVGCFPLLLACAVPVQEHGFRSAARVFGVFALAAMVPTAAYLAFRITYFGDVVPNTYHVKGGPTLPLVVNLLALTKPGLDQTYELLHGVLGVAAAWFAIVLVFSGTVAFNRTARRMMAITLAMFVVASWAVFMLLPEDWMEEYRFATPFIVAWVTAMFLFVAEFLSSTQLFGPRLKRAAFILFIMLATANSWFVFSPRTREFAADPTVPFARVALQTARAADVYVAYLELPEATLLCPDVGGAYYYSPHRVYDLVGLCDPKIAQLWAMRNAGRVRDYLFDELKPTIVMIHSRWSANLAAHGDERFTRDYVAIWEAPFIQTVRGRQFRSTSGAYVRRDALESEERLVTLQEFLAEHVIAPLEIGAVNEAFEDALSARPTRWKGEGTGGLSPFAYHPADGRAP